MPVCHVYKNIGGFIVCRQTEEIEISRLIKKTDSRTRNTDWKVNEKRCIFFFEMG